MNTSSGNQKAPISLRLKNRLALKEASKKENSSRKGSCKLISKVGDGMGKNDGSKQELPKYEDHKKGVISLSSKIAAKCKLKKGVKNAAVRKDGTKGCGKEGQAALGKEGKAALGKEGEINPGKESVDNDLASQRNIKAVKSTGETLHQVKGRPRRRVSRVNYSEGVLEKGAATAEVDNASEGNRCSDEEDVGGELRPSDGKRKGKCRFGEPEAEEQECSQGM